MVADTHAANATQAPAGDDRRRASEAPDHGAATPLRREPAKGSGERQLLLGALLTLGALAVPVVAAAWWLAGANGALSAAIGLGFVLVMFGASAALVLVIARRGGGSGIWLLTGAAIARLPLYLVALIWLGQLSWVDGRSLAAATAIGIVVTLAAELRVMARTPRLFWVDASAARPQALVNDTRS